MAVTGYPSQCTPNSDECLYENLKPLAHHYPELCQQLCKLWVCQSSLTVKLKVEQSKTAVEQTGFVVWVSEMEGTDGSNSKQDLAVKLKDNMNLQNEGHTMYGLLVVTAHQRPFLTDSNRITVTFGLDKGQGKNKKEVSVNGEADYKTYTHLNEIGYFFLPIDDHAIASELSSKLDEFYSIDINALRLPKESEHVFSYMVFYNCDDKTFQASDGSGKQMEEENAVLLWPSDGSHPWMYHNLRTEKGSIGAVGTTLSKQGLQVYLHLVHSNDHEGPNRTLAEFLGGNEGSDESGESRPLANCPPGTEKEKGPVKPVEIPPVNNCAPGSERKNGGIKVEVFQGQVRNIVSAFILYFYAALISSLKNLFLWDFIPVKNIKIGNLPDYYRNKDILKYICLSAALTVQLVTSIVSKNRPDHDPFTKKRYIFGDKKGKRHPHGGTGFVYEVRKNGKTCQCIGQESDKSAEGTCYTIVTITATHVVFDQEEASETEARFAYFENNENVASIFVKGGCKHCVINEDVSWLEFTTHDEKLCKELLKSLIELSQVKENLSQNENYKDSVIIVSHPDGRSKQYVSFGNKIKESDAPDLQKAQCFSCCSMSPVSQALLRIVGWISHWLTSLRKWGQSAKTETSQPQNTNIYYFQWQFHGLVKSLGKDSMKKPGPVLALLPRTSFEPFIFQLVGVLRYSTPTRPGCSGAMVCDFETGAVYTHYGKDDASTKDKEINTTGGGFKF